MDVSKISLKDVVLHSIPRAKVLEKDAATLRLTDAPVALDSTKRLFLEEKIKGALSARARPVVEDPGAGSVAAATIRTYLLAEDSDRDLVAVSKDLAVRLHRAQSGISPGGMVLVARLDFGGSDALLIAKLDQQVGMRAFMTDEDGLTTVDIEYLDDLFVTQGTKVFKVGVFAAADIRDRKQLSGSIADEQVSGQGVAHYFMTMFGCGFSQRAEELTEQFVAAATRVFNSPTVPDAEKRARYTVALLSELQSQKTEINLQQFATTNLDRGDRDAFIAEMTKAGVTSGIIKKDTSLVASRLKRVQIETDSDVFILASPDQIDDGTIKLTKRDDGHDLVEINDQVRRVTNRS